MLRPSHVQRILMASLVFLASCGAPPEAPGTVRVAVAANFSQTHRELTPRFEGQTGYRVQSSVGATGQLYAQIRSGAPYDVFLAADALRPRLLEEEGLAVPGSRFVYATGRLVLYGPGLDSVRSGGVDLTPDGVTHLAIANPRTAPYGSAAETVLDRLQVGNQIRSGIAQGGDVGHVLQFVRSGAAELGFVALSQVVSEPRRTYWLVPSEYHPPLTQEVVLLNRGSGNPAAEAYLEFLASELSAQVIISNGYERGGFEP
jgi:molybdate transport system substrate-binding protein